MRSVITDITNITYIPVHSDINIVRSNVCDIMLKVYNLIWNYAKLNYTVSIYLPDKSIILGLLNNPMMSLLSTPATLKLYTFPDDNSIIVNIVIFPLVLAVLSPTVSLIALTVYLVIQIE